MTDHPTVWTSAEIAAWRRGDKIQHRVPLDPQPHPQACVVMATDYASGDLLIVLEEGEYKCTHGHDLCSATYPGPECPYCEHLKAADLTIPITAVRIERVQDIGWIDAVAEGVHDPRWSKHRIHPVTGCVAKFAECWNERHGSGAWERNDWVVVLELGHE